jgi:superfamily II DNA/RNA helicase
MRMVCDSTYLLDDRSDHGPKADEATTLLEELLDQRGTKVVVFSQWLRMHELLLRRIKPRRWGHVMFHGGVPGSKRKDLIDRFREDPACRVFLSTDAGGVGLNLQHASVVFNMDLPWNPAVLEQRIGRVHRLGQQQPVRVINFVARGTIEEGMLGVLQFKKSLFAGVLDGGEKNIFLGGSRLTKFMEQVEAATGSIPAGFVEEAEEAPDAATDGKAARRKRPAPAGPTEPEEEPAAAAAAADPWGALLQAGMALWQQLSSAAQPVSPGGQGQAAQPASVLQSLMKQDEQTGETYLKLPVPSPEVVEQALRAVGTLLEGLRK